MGIILIFVFISYKHYRDFDEQKLSEYKTENVDNLVRFIKKCALNNMIDDKIYKKILDNFELKDEIAKENNIPLCFLYSRLAYDKKIAYSSKEYLNNIERI